MIHQFCEMKVRIYFYITLHNATYSNPSNTPFQSLRQALNEVRWGGTRVACMDLDEWAAPTVLRHDVNNPGQGSIMGNRITVLAETCLKNTDLPRERRQAEWIGARSVPDRAQVCVRSSCSHPVICHGGRECGNRISVTLLDGSICNTMQAVWQCSVFTG